MNRAYSGKIHIVNLQYNEKKLFKREVQWCFKIVKFKLFNDYFRIKVQETVMKEQFYAF